MPLACSFAVKTACNKSCKVMGGVTMQLAYLIVTRIVVLDGLDTADTERAHTLQAVMQPITPMSALPLTLYYHLCLPPSET